MAKNRRVETPLYRWWREESWVDLPEDPTVPTEPLDAAIALADWLRQPDTHLDRAQDYSGHLCALLNEKVWQLDYPEKCFYFATNALYTRTPYTVIGKAYARVYTEATTRELCARVRCNQGALAAHQENPDAVFMFTRDAISLLPEADQRIRESTELSVYLQRSRAYLLQDDYNLAFNEALHASTLANYHSGGRPVIESIYGHLALCAVLDNRIDMAQAWLQRFADPTAEGNFARDVVTALIAYQSGKIDNALPLVRLALANWPHHVLRRKNSYLAKILVTVYEQILLSRGISPHDIIPFQA